MKFAKLKKTVVGSLMLTILISSLATVAEAGEGSFESLKGKDRVETSIKVSRLVKSDTLVVANAYKYADSLSAYNIASKNKAKLILIDDNTDLSKEIKNQKITKIYVVGGENSVKGNVINSIYDSVGEKNVKRLYGKDRYETNEKTLNEAGYKSVGVADGRNFADALASSGVLNNEKLGLMLVDGSKEIKTDKNIVYTFGGEKSVKYAKGKRIAGKSRYETNRLINRETKSTDVAIVDGNDFADAMSSINILCSNENPTSIALVGKLDSETEKEIARYSKKFMVGGSLGAKIENILKEKFEKPKKDEKKDEKKEETASRRSSSGGGSSSRASVNAVKVKKDHKPIKIKKDSRIEINKGDSLNIEDYRKCLENLEKDDQIVIKKEINNSTIGETTVEVKITGKDNFETSIKIPVLVKEVKNPVNEEKVENSQEKKDKDNEPRIEDKETDTLKSEKDVEEPKEDVIKTEKDEERKLPELKVKDGVKIEIYRGDSVDIDYKEYLENIDAGDKFEEIKAIDSSKAGDTELVIKAVRSNKSEGIYRIPVIVKEKPAEKPKEEKQKEEKSKEEKPVEKTKEEKPVQNEQKKLSEIKVKEGAVVELYKGDKVEIDYSKYLENMDKDDNIVVTKAIDSSKAGNSIFEFYITRSDKTKVEIKIPVVVKEKEAPKQEKLPAIQIKEGAVVELYKGDKVEIDYSKYLENIDKNDEFKVIKPINSSVVGKSEFKFEVHRTDNTVYSITMTAIVKEKEKPEPKGEGKVTVKDKNTYYIINAKEDINYKDYLINWKNRDDIESIVVEKPIDKSSYSIQKARVRVNEKNGNSYTVDIEFQQRPMNTYLVTGEKPNFERAIPGFKDGDKLEKIDGNEYAPEKFAFGVDKDKKVSELKTQSVKMNYVHDGKTEEVNFDLFLRESDESKILKNQKDIDKYFFNSINDGLEKDTLYIKKEFVQGNDYKFDMHESKPIDTYLEGLGLQYDTHIEYMKNEIEDYIKTEINPALISFCYSNKAYDKNEFGAHMKKVDKIIENSRVKNLSTDKEKAVEFALYLKDTYKYNSDTFEKFSKYISEHGDTIENEKAALENKEFESSVGPYSITDYGKGWCCAFVYTYNQAMHKLGIPVLSVQGYMTNDDGSKGGRHINTYVYYDGKWNELNVTGHNKDAYPQLSREKKLEDLKRGMIHESEKKYSYEELNKMGEKLFGDRLK